MSAPGDLEQRIRESLAARAAGVDATPALWERVQQHAHRHRRRQMVSVVALVAAVLVVVGLASTLVRPPAPEIDLAPQPEDAAPEDGGQASAGPQTWTVDVDGVLESPVIPGANVSIQGYLPTELTVRPGDTVEFAVQPGNVHTVTFGTLVDAALAAGPGGPDGPSPELEALPDARTLEGEGVATGLAPCFSDSPPDDGSACAEQEQPVFDGDLALYSSGALQPGSTFTMEIAQDIEPGDYGYLCLLHDLPMSGTITVADDAGEGVSTPDEVEDDRNQTLETLAVAMEAPVSDFRPGRLTSFYLAEDVFTDGDDATVVASSFGGPRSYYVEILEFGPTSVEVEAGQTVRWHFQTGGHTISFNPTPDATPYIVTGDDGLPTTNELAVAAQGGATPIPPREELVPDPEPDSFLPATVVDGGEWDGQGFFSSGIAPAFAPVSYDITFTEPGTYDYQCLIHPGMTGTVDVTG